MGILDSFKQGVDKAFRTTTPQKPEQVRADLIRQVQEAKTPEELATIQEKVNQAQKKAQE